MAEATVERLVRSKTSRVLTFASIGLGLLAGPAQARDGRLYAGDPRPAGETAVIAYEGIMWVSSIARDGEPEMKLGQVAGIWKKTSLSAIKTYMVEVLPGHYRACVLSQGLYLAQNCVEFDAQPGHAYFADMQTVGPAPPPAQGQSIRPVFVDLAGEDASKSMKDSKQKAVDTYLQGDRPALVQDGKGHWK
jgi:hypothetical protein